jgi:hypothetical protein
MSAEPTGLGAPLAVYRERARADGAWTYVHPVALPDGVDRNRYLEALVAGRRIVHVGCATEGETLKQFQCGKLLFERLERVAAAQLGVDPDARAMHLLADVVSPRWPLQVCRLDDLDPGVLDRLRPELILMPEVIEHVPDPGALVRDACALAARYGAEIVLTVPNALAFTAIAAWWSGQETVHPDHVSTYTPRTLQTLLEKCGVLPLEIRPYYWGAPPPPARVLSLGRVLVRSRGGLRVRMRAALEALLAPRFPDGWVARGAPAS